MESPIIFRNRDIEEVLIGAPEGHRHLRVAVKTTQGTFVLQEATLANLVRAYVTLKTHPVQRAMRLKRCELKDRKSGFAPDQLMETGRDKEDPAEAERIESELAALLDNQ